MEATPDPVRPATPVAAVATDLHCRACGYNLRGLPRDGFCPECATDIAGSHAVPPLFTADGPWLLALRRGASLAWAGLAAGLLAVAFAYLISGRKDALIQPDQALAVGLPLGALLVVIGGWFISTPEPAQRNAPAVERARRCARVGAILGAAYLGVGWLERNSILDSIYPINVFLLTGLTVGAAAGAVGSVFYLASLSTRIPSAPLARAFRVTAWGLAAVLSVIALYFVATPVEVFWQPRPQWGSTILIIVFFSGFYALFGLLGMLAVLMILLWQFSARLPPSDDTENGPA